MSLSVDNLRANLTGGGARPSLFQCQVFFPGGALGNAFDKFRFMCKASQIPESTIGTIEVPYMGRKIKVSGDRTFSEWSVTVINDEDFVVRNAFELWMNAINHHSRNVRNQFATRDPESYKTTAMVTQYSKDGSALRTYTFVGLHPSSVAAIELGWESTDAIEEFGVTFQYDYWTVTGATGNAGGTGDDDVFSVSGSLSLPGVNIGGGITF